MEIVKDDFLEDTAGGFATVSDPIYKLTKAEEKVLSKAGYTITKTNKGNCRVTKGGATIDPKTLEGMCRVVAIAEEEAKKNNNSGRTFWDWLSGN